MKGLVDDCIKMKNYVVFFNFLLIKLGFLNIKLKFMKVSGN